LLQANGECFLEGLMTQRSTVTAKAYRLPGRREECVNKAEMGNQNQSRREGRKEIVELSKL